MLPAALVVLAAAGVLLAGVVALAGPAAAIQDPRRPTAEVTHGPSCGPGVVRLAVTNGTAAHRVALLFDGVREQGAAELASGEQTVLTSTDVDWGTTVDVSLAVTDAVGVAQEPLLLGSYTRPSAADCAGTAPATAPPPAAGDVPAASVSPGGVVTVRATGFAPGEPVTVSLQGVDVPLTTVTAAGDGSVRAVVQIPRRTSLGAATVQLVGGVSAATTGLDLLVAARTRPAGEPTTAVPALAAGTALTGAAALLGRTARRSRGPATPAHR